MRTVSVAFTRNTARFGFTRGLHSRSFDSLNTTKTCELEVLFSLILVTREEGQAPEHHHRTKPATKAATMLSKWTSNSTTSLNSDNYWDGRFTNNKMNLQHEKGFAPLKVARDLTSSCYLFQTPKYHFKVTFQGATLPFRISIQQQPIQS